MSASFLETELQILYFAYGSNLDKTQMGRRCPQAIRRSKAMLPGYRFIINCRGVASIVADDQSKVEGLLWVLTENDEKALDHCEGVSSGYYEKRWLDVIMPDSSEIKALVYIATTNVIGTPRHGYLEKIVTAAECLEFSSSYVEHLKSWQEHARPKG